MDENTAIIAIINNQIVGFAEFEANGHIDCFYCHPDFQGKGLVHE